jgi:predicted  nucleic acid-binding Zn-ribbon protein
MADIDALESRLRRLDVALNKCEKKIAEQAETIKELREELRDTQDRMQRMEHSFQEWQQFVRCMIPEVTKRIQR